MRILVVEDDPIVCDLLREFLVGLRHEPRIVHTAEAALDLLRGERPDVILLDIRLPGMSGLDFLQLQAVRELHVPILVVSGDVTETQVQESLRAGASGWEVGTVLIRSDSAGSAFYFPGRSAEQLGGLRQIAGGARADQPGHTEPHLRIRHRISQAFGPSLDVDEVLRIALDALT